MILQVREPENLESVSSASFLVKKEKLTFITLSYGQCLMALLRS